MGPHQLAHGNLTSAMPSPSHAPPDGKRRALGERQRTSVKPVRDQEKRESGTAHGDRRENTESGSSRSSPRRSRRRQENLALKTKVEARDSVALRKESEYRILISSEDAADEDWVMVDVSKLILK